MSYCYRHPCYSVRYSPCYRTVCRSQTYSLYNPCNYRSLCHYGRRYSCGDCHRYRTTYTTRYYYPSCYDYGYRCCYYPCS